MENLNLDIETKEEEKEIFNTFDTVIDNIDGHSPMENNLRLFAQTTRD
jgi:hypothetical protein